MRIIAFVCQAALLAGVAAGADTGEFFESKVRPVLAANCYSCHTDSRMGGLRLDSADAVQKGGKSGPPIVPGKPDDSLLIQAIRQTHPRLKMPPGGKLKDEEIAAIAEWVKSGAVWPAGAAPVSKVTTPEYVMDKATKLETIFDRIDECHWSAFPEGTVAGDAEVHRGARSFVTIVGQYRESGLRLRIYCTPPADITPGLRQYADGSWEAV